MNIVAAVADWFAQPQHWQGPAGIWARLAEHVYYSGLALALSALLAVPLGLLTGHTGRGGFLAISLANFARALPTIGVLTLVVLGLGLGVVPVLVALVALAVPPILVNTYEGVRGVDPRLKDAAAGMGMRGGEVLWRVEVPLAMPLILLGLRTAAIQVVATATIAAYVGIGGLGRFIVDGQRQQLIEQILGGSVLVVALALAVTALFALLRRLVVAKGLRVPPTGAAR
ncbi:ABC transporter permease [Streptomonospora nanhaiensis]|uniref:Osmoprotectant transport system permease protein n=1 Tax=Streptomonospora nanhaiensis TaxID=1323731 RepID=A0A853BJV7_9ACTN|nr:ABC transporter permease subunit [Streptomonospora nanhaiensis]MBV2365909.1 ABC transporter permease subunit [Streptomonospora nanhaiensis]NYI95798.1 osmoprotectant transport system permease protein [Streptomonospora nanhaiensis]